MRAASLSKPPIRPAIGELSVHTGHEDNEGAVTAAESAPILIDAAVEPSADYVARLAELEEPPQELIA